MAQQTKTDMWTGHHATKPALSQNKVTFDGRLTTLTVAEDSWQEAKQVHDNI